MKFSVFVRLLPCVSPQWSVCDFGDRASCLCEKENLLLELVLTGGNHYKRQSWGTGL